jgi:hypothetical protein
MGLLETAIAVILISLLIVVFFNRILAMSVAIERESMRQTIIHINSILNIEALTLIVKNDQEGFAKREGINPVDLMTPGPSRYAGSFHGPDPKEITPGTWYFDESKKQLVYRVNHVDRFAGGRAIPERIRFQVEPVFNDLNSNGIKDEGEDYGGLRLRSIDNYEWLEAGEDY